MWPMWDQAIEFLLAKSELLLFLVFNYPLKYVSNFHNVLLKKYQLSWQVNHVSSFPRVPYRDGGGPGGGLMLTERQVLPGDGKRRPHTEARNSLVEPPIGRWAAVETGASTSLELPTVYSLGSLPNALTSLQAHCPFTTWAPLGLSPTDPPTWGLAPVFSISHHQHISLTRTWCTPSCHTRGGIFGFGRWMPMVATQDKLIGAQCRTALHIPDLQWPVASSPSLFGQISSLPYPHDMRANPQICTPQGLTQTHPRRTPAITTCSLGPPSHQSLLPQLCLPFFQCFKNWSLIHLHAC